MKHKHCDVIKAWADGAEIECNFGAGEGWNITTSPAFFHDFAYRVKPEPKPDVVVFHGFEKEILDGFSESKFYYVEHWTNILKLVFDGESGKLKSAEVLK